MRNVGKIFQYSATLILTKYNTTQCLTQISLKWWI